MRLDKYLKISRIFKRRTVAKDVSAAERVLVNERIAKPSTAVKPEDIITVTYGNRLLKVRVLSIEENPKKVGPDGLYAVIADEKIDITKR